MRRERGKKKYKHLSMFIFAFFCYNCLFNLPFYCHNFWKILSFWDVITHRGEYFQFWIRINIYTLKIPIGRHILTVQGMEFKKSIAQQAFVVGAESEIYKTVAEKTQIRGRTEYFATLNFKFRDKNSCPFPYFCNRTTINGQKVASRGNT